jgi:hypothetical protein
MPITPTYIPMATASISSPTTSVTFSNIPSTYLHLVIHVNSIRPLLSNGNGEGQTIVRFNGDGGSNYEYIQFTADQNGSLTTAGTRNQMDLMISSYEDDLYPANHELQIFGYSLTDKHKTAISVGGIGTGNQFPRTGIHSYRWKNNNAISSITLTSDYAGGRFTTGTRISLYGIAG